jgi:biopolymer transport protein ExbB
MTSKRFLFGAVAAVLLAAFSAHMVRAQDEAPPEGAEVAGTTEEVVAKETSLWGIIKQGGITMFPLGLLSVAGIGLIIYGFMIVRTDKMLKLELVPQLQDDLTNLNYEDAKNLCISEPCIMTNILNAGLDRISDGVLDVPSMEKAMEEASVQEVTVGMRPISYLSIIAQVAPMLGLFGTVLGMIKAFQKISLGGMGNAELLAGHIGEAMVTTATGLVIAIPTMLFYFYLKTRFMSNVSQLSRVLGNLTHHVVAASRRGE